MKLRLESAAAALLSAYLSFPVLAEEPAPKPLAAPPAPAQSIGGMMGGGMMGGMSEEAKDQHLKIKQEHFLKMVELSDKILAAKDDKERDRLKAEQLQLMKEHDKTMHQAMQQHMQQMMQHGGGAPGQGGMGGMGGGVPGQGGMGGMQHGAGGGAMGQGGMGGMQHGAQPAAPAAPPAAAPEAPAH